MSRDVQRVTPEIPRELYDYLVAEAERQTRTVHQQIVHILQADRARHEKGIPVIGRGEITAISERRG